MRSEIALVPRARETLTGLFLVVLVTPSEARGVTPFMPLRGRTSALDEGEDPPAHSDEVAVGEEARAWRGPGGFAEARGVDRYSRSSGKKNFSPSKLAPKYKYEVLEQNVQLF